jgi:hypothetical protein
VESAIVSASSAIERGNNFELASGTGPIFNLTKDLNIIDFTPIPFPLDS